MLELLQPVVEPLQRILAEMCREVDPHALVRKLAHFTEYFILGGLLYLDWRLLNRGRVILPLGAGLIFAAADEYLQTFIPGRGGEILDTLLDFCGVAAAFTAALLLRRRRGGRNC